MKQRKKNALRRQLQGQAALLEKLDGVKLTEAVTEACRAMLQVALTEDTPQGSAQESELIRANLAGMAKMITNAFTQMKTVTDADRQKIQQELDGEVLAEEQLRSSLSKVRAELAKGKQATEQKRQELARAQQEWQDVSDDCERLRQQLAAMPSDKLEEMRREQQYLTEEYQHKQPEWKAQEDKNQELRERLDKLKADFEAQPEEHRRLLEACDDAQKRMERLKDIIERYSPEKQQLLEQQIEEMRSHAETNRTNCEELERRLEELQEKNIVYSNQHEKLSTDLFARIDHALADFSKVLGGHEERLHQVKTQADALSSRLSECEKLRDQYRNWLDADVTPLDAMAAALSRPEAETLRATLDPGRLQSVKELRERIGSDIKQLDKILKTCSESMQQDRNRINSLARL